MFAEEGWDIGDVGGGEEGGFGAVDVGGCVGVGRCGCDGRCGYDGRCGGDGGGGFFAPGFEEFAAAAGFEEGGDKVPGGGMDDIDEQAFCAFISAVGLGGEAFFFEEGSDIRRGRGGDKLQFVDDFELSSEVSGEGYLLRGELFLKTAVDRLYVGFNLGVEVAALVFEEEFYGVADVLLGLFAEAFIEEQSVLLAGVEEFADRFDLYFFPDGRYFFWSESFDLEHGDDSRGCSVDIFMKKSEFAGFEDFLDFFADCVADPFYGGEFLRGQVLDGFGEFFERKSGY